MCINISSCKGNITTDKYLLTIKGLMANYPLIVIGSNHKQQPRKRPGKYFPPLSPKNGLSLPKTVNSPTILENCRNRESISLSL